MDFDVKKRTILYVRHGSHAYGLNVATSDEDFKGVAIAPKEYYLGFMKTFEQAEHMGSKSDGVDSVTYALNKFARLAADCNPNIIEILHVADRHVLKIDEFGEELRSIKDEFLSKKAKFTFSGYAHAQLQRIKTHRSWLLNPPKEAPSRKSFGLSETSKVSKSELGAYDAAVADGIELDLPKDVLTLFTREKQYQAAKTHYDQYVNWLKTRNPARAELEAKWGFDVKHGMHLIRLKTMAVEILEDHKVYVDRQERGDREEILAYRRGEHDYDALIERADALEKRANELYETSTLRREPDRKLIDKFVVSMTERYLTLHG
jgi:hypothetical protein